MLVCRKNFVPHYRKIGAIWCNFKRFDTILNSEVLLNLIRKITYLTAGPLRGKKYAGTRPVLGPLIHYYRLRAS